LNKYLASEPKIRFVEKGTRKGENVYLALAEQTLEDT